jgi:hypothetical protein
MSRAAEAPRLSVAITTGTSPAKPRVSQRERLSDSVLPGPGAQTEGLGAVLAGGRLKGRGSSRPSASKGHNRRGSC